MEQACHSIGGTLSIVEKEELAFVRALGDMQTRSTGTRQQFRELQNSILDLSTVYTKLTTDEQSSPFGQALSASIDKLKQRAGSLRDQMDDLNQELRNIASDTAFTDSINLMTSTIGACSAAMVAWSGDSKELDKVIKDLAKITTTVAAVEALTKAFQKQNMVLLKNPYVALLSSLAAVAVAYSSYADSCKTATQRQIELDKEISDKAISSTNEEIIRVNLLNERLHDNTRSIEERTTALNTLQSIIPEYHGSLTKEGKLINDNAEAVSTYTDNLLKAAQAQAAFDKIAELSKKMMDNDLSIGKQNSIIEKTRPSTNNATSVSMPVGQTGISIGNAIGVADDTRYLAAKRQKERLEAENRTLQGQIDILKNRIDTSAIKGGSSSSTGTTGSGGSSSKSYSAPELIIETKETPIERAIRESQERATLEIKPIMDPALVQSTVNDTLKGIHLEPLPIMVDVVRAEAYKKLMEEAEENAEKELKQNDYLKNLSKEANAVGRSFSGAAAAITAFGEDSKEAAAAASVLTFASTVASLMASFAKTLTTTRHWGEWIAAGLAGTAALGTMVSQLKQINSQKYSEGGEVRGSLFAGDAVPALLNSGERVLTAEQSLDYANAISSTTHSQQPSHPYVLGQHIYLGLNNYLQQSGRGQLVTTR